MADPSAPTLPSWNPPPPDMPITSRLNLFLVALVTGLAIFLLWLASRFDSWWAVLGVGVVFSYVLLTNYALMHEATHGNLHSSSRVNYLLGLWTGAFFPVPFTMIRTTHQGHHLRNRTDFEMFDLYYPTDSRLLKYAQWYSILGGLFWPVIPLGAVLFALCPSVLRTRAFRAPTVSYRIGRNSFLSQETSGISNPRFSPLITSSGRRPR